MAPGVGEISTGDSSVCRTGGSASMRALRQGQARRVQHPDHLRQQAVEVLAQDGQVARRGVDGVQQRVQQVPQQVAVAGLVEGVDRDRRGLQHRPSRFRSIGGTVSSRNWSGPRLTGGVAAGGMLGIWAFSFVQELRQPGVHVIDGQCRPAGCKTNLQRYVFFFFFWWRQLRIAKSMFITAVQSAAEIAQQMEQRVHQLEHEDSSYPGYKGRRGCPQRSIETPQGQPLASLKLYSKYVY